MFGRVSGGIFPKSIFHTWEMSVEFSEWKTSAIVRGEFSGALISFGFGSCRRSYCRYEACRVKYYVRGENLGMETRCREFKLGRGNLDTHLPDAVSKYVSAFLNSEGGTLMLGVNDKGTVVG